MPHHRSCMNGSQGRQTLNDRFVNCPNEISDYFNEIPGRRQYNTSSSAGISKMVAAPCPAS